MTNKVPCGGFLLGAGLGIDKNTLVYNNCLKINKNVTMEGATYEIASDSPLKNVEDVKKQIENGSIFVMIENQDLGDFEDLFTPNKINMMHILDASESLEITLSRTYAQKQLSKYKLVKEDYVLKSDGTITVSSTSFSLGDQTLD